MKKYIAIGLFLFSSLLSFAQTDSVWMEGRVTEASTGKPKTNCEVQFFQDNELKAVAFCDGEGYYSVGLVPAGAYSLSVVSEGSSLYFAELQLTESAMVNITLLPAVGNVHNLETVKIKKPKHYLGQLLITSPDDWRLWNFCNNPVLFDIGPASFAGSNCKGAEYFSNPRNLAGERPKWLDEPIQRQVEVKKEYFFSAFVIFCLQTSLL